MTLDELQSQEHHSNWISLKDQQSGARDYSVMVSELETMVFDFLLCQDEDELGTESDVWARALCEGANVLLNYLSDGVEVEVPLGYAWSFLEEASESEPDFMRMAEKLREECLYCVPEEILVEDAQQRCARRQEQDEFS